MGEHEYLWKVTDEVIKTFNLDIEKDTPIFCGESNRNHMKETHPEDYELYGDKIKEILESPDYIAKHPKKDSIEYIKVFKKEDDDYVLVAVRATGKGILFARTLFVMDKEKVKKYRNKNALKPYNK